MTPSRRVLLGIGAIVVVAGLAAAAVATLDDDPSGSEPDAEADAPVDLAVVGDSFAEQSGDALLQMSQDRGLSASVDAFGGSSLCAWMERIEELAEYPPSQLVLSFAGNIFQQCVNPTCEPGRETETCQHQDPELTASRYREHLDQALALFDPEVTEVYVVLPPPIGEELMEQSAAAMREMYRAAPQDHPELHVVDSAVELDPDGRGFVTTLPCADGDDCPEGEAEVVVRQDDNIHLTPAGGRRYAQAIFAALDLPRT